MPSGFMTFTEMVDWIMFKRSLHAKAQQKYYAANRKEILRKQWETRQRAQHELMVELGYHP